MEENRHFDLNQYIKYCLGYLSLTKPTGFKKASPMDVKLPSEYFSLLNFVNGVLDGSMSEGLSLDLYYNVEPKDVTEEIESKYEEQKNLARKVQEIYNKFKNDSFTKESVLRFGCFDFQVAEKGQITDDETSEAPEGDQPVEERKFTTKQFYLFSVPVSILKKKKSSDVDAYSFEPLDTDVRLNLGALYEIFSSYGKEDLVYEFLAEYSGYEAAGKFSIPISSESDLMGLWDILKSKLRLTDAVFNEESFRLHDVFLTLQARSNYFLVEDLTKMSKMKESELEESSLSSWFKTDGLGINSEVPKDSELYFPFQHDKFQSGTTSLLSNKASIIQGPPGTGKSETIANIISHLTVQGNSVLFVSQKAQAIRVVKDKLKTLEAPLFFGYIPSSKSEADEEADTISSQLTGLDNYIGNIRNGADPDLTSFVTSTVEVKDKREKVIELEAEYYSLATKLKTLEYLNGIPTNNTEAIIQNLTEGLKNHFCAIHTKLLEDQKIISVKKPKMQFDPRLFNGSSISQCLEKIHGDVTNYGYDRNSFIGKHVNGFRQKLRLRSELKGLPLEVYEVVDRVLSSDASKRKKLDEIENMVDSCKYYEAVSEEKSISKEIEEIEQNLQSPKNWMLDLSRFLDDEKITVGEFVSQLSNRQGIKAKMANIRSEMSGLKSDITSGELKISRKSVVASYIRNMISARIQKHVIGNENIETLQILKVLQRAFSKSKKAFKTFDKIKKESANFLTLQKIVPVWIMDLDDASRLLPLEREIFDYVIFDEASQCNVAYTLPSMYRAKHSIFVGDSEQMRDPTIAFKSNRAFDELAIRFSVPEFMQIKPMSSSVQSVLDIAGTRFGLPKTLQYHYRSPAELIGFSNRYFYEPKAKPLIALNNKYLTYKDTNRIMLIHQVTPDGDIGDSTNLVEAQKALSLYEDMLGDSTYADKSFAILAFFNDQANLIRKVFEDAGHTESENLKIAIIEGIQGDEKDVVIYSFVIRDASQKRQYGMLTGEGGDIRADISAGRVNVAFSRAKLQVHCITSMAVSNFPSGIWIKKYLEYVEECGEIKDYSKLEKFDSYFEEEFYAYMKNYLGSEYLIQNQVKSCGFKIDFVAINKKTGKRLAIECDGPTHFKDSVDESYGIYVEGDIDRQMVLESAGWSFYRVGYSDWCESDEDEKKNFILGVDSLLR